MCASSLFALIACEVGLRLFLPQQLIKFRPDIWESVDGLGWQYVPNCDTSINTGEREVKLYTDVEGFRVASEERPLPTEKKILALGDSITTALQVEYEQTFTGLLEARLNNQSQGEVRVANAGVSGWGPNQYRIKLQRELSDPDSTWDMVAVFFYLGNDFERARIESFPPRVSKVKRFGWPRNLSKKEMKKKVFYPINNFLESRSHLFSFLKNRGKFLLVRAGLSAHYLHYGLWTSSREDESWKVTADLCEEIQLIAKRKDVPITFFLIPSVYIADPLAVEALASASGFSEDQYDADQPANILTGLLTDRGVSFVDLTPAFQERSQLPLFGQVDTHLSPEGHELIAEMIEPIIRNELEEATRE